MNSIKSIIDQICCPEKCSGISEMSASSVMAFFWFLHLGENLLIHCLMTGFQCDYTLLLSMNSLFYNL